jgi:hypothetical protein
MIMSCLVRSNVVVRDVLHLFGQFQLPPIGNAITANFQPSKIGGFFFEKFWGSESGSV